MSGSRKRKPLLKQACKNSNKLRLKEPFVDEPGDEESDFPITPVLCRKPSVQEILNDQLSKTTRTRSGKIKTSTRRRVFFIFGSLIGFCVAYFFAAGPGQDLAAPIVSNWTSYLNEQLQMSDVDWASILPDNTLVDELLQNFTGRLFPEKTPPVPDEGSPGAELRDQGARPKHPVVFIPGVISTGLRSWGFENCSKKYFRQRLWGTMTMFRSVLTDRDCWLQSMKLDESTGLDPPGFKLRAAQGLDAADYFVTGYWVWGKLIENFAAVGYDNNNMHLAAYDWRLAYDNLEKRDRFFSKLKSTLEQSKLNSGEKAVVLSHSMGSLVWYYFLKWVESKLGGNGGPQWVEDHIHATINIAGALLGAPKTMPTLLSGEQRETVQPMAQYVLERFLSRMERAKLFRNWGGLWSLMPKGGDVLWGDHHSAPDDLPNSSHRTNGEMFVLPSDSITGRNFTVSEAFDLLFASSAKHLKKNMLKHYSYGAAKSERELRNDEPAAWSNPPRDQPPGSPFHEILLSLWTWPGNRTVVLSW
ncbi:phospholipid:diacylglycerol acyltransferase [Entomophthora muscae]|uniref:Phospholipid:diacylglycerol acyltransferase n=1 Tax=Entomophthora muscae TaxID=34485 RepID=A0ACC2TMK2_9FUNG|nr:phospholipid:diacylglycerol acyltransferase [Entomophthora muscae]